MNKIFDITKNDEGQFQIVDAKGVMVDGPFETNAAAWSALDRLDNAAFDGMNKVRNSKPEPKHGKGRKKSRKQVAKEDRAMRKNAAKAPSWIRGMAMGKFDPAGKRAFRDQKLGTFGAASPVKRIDPATYLAEKAARGD